MFNIQKLDMYLENEEVMYNSLDILIFYLFYSIFIRQYSFLNHSSQ